MNPPLRFTIKPRSDSTVEPQPQPPPSAKQKRELKLRSMFVPAPGCVFVSFDLKQAESWCVAYLSNEPTMKHELATGDIHSLTASAVYHITPTEVKADKKRRYVGKQSNHMLAYRATSRRLVQAINKESDGLITVSNQEGDQIFKIWHSLYHIDGWWREIEDELARNGRTLVTPYGRVRTFFAPWGNELFKQATAHLPQSIVGDHNKGAAQPELGIEGGLKKVYEKFVLAGACSVVNEGHDSILTEVPTSLVGTVAPAIRAEMERPLVIKGEQFTIPVEVEIGERWGEMEEWRP